MGIDAQALDLPPDRVDTLAELFGLRLVPDPVTYLQGPNCAFRLVTARSFPTQSTTPQAVVQKRDV